MPPDREEETAAMKHKVKVDVVTEKKGFFGKRQVVEKRTITVNGREFKMHIESFLHRSS